MSGTITPAVTIDECYDPGRAWHEGVMGLALHPELQRGTGHDHVFVAYTYDADSGPALARRFKVRRYTHDPLTQKLMAPIDIITNIPAHVDHAGGRLVIGPDLKLYLSRGDGGANFINTPCLPNHAQDLPTAAQLAAADWSAYDGKILRLNLDCSVPSDNPVNWQGTFTSPLRTFFTPPEGYSVEKSGSATIAVGGLEVYSARPGIAGWAHVDSAGQHDDGTRVPRQAQR